jgi:hypothetical protein
MFIATLDENRRVTAYFVPKLPQDIERFGGDPSIVYLDRSLFKNDQFLLQFKRNFRNYTVTSEGKLLLLI